MNQAAQVGATFDVLLRAPTDDPNSPSQNFKTFCETRLHMVARQLNHYIVHRFTSDVRAIQTDNAARGVVSIHGPFTIEVPPPGNSVAPLAPGSARSSQNFLQELDVAESLLRVSDPEFQAPFEDYENLPEGFRRLSNPRRNPT